MDCAGRLAGSVIRRQQLVVAVSIDERSERAPKLRRQVVFLDRSEERDRRLVRFQLRDAARAGGEVTLEIGVLLRRQVMLDEVREKPDEIVAAASLRHGQSFQLLGLP